MSRKYKNRKTIFWIVTMFLFLFVLASCYYLSKEKTVNQYIRVGICGAVRVPAVYTVREGSDLGMLIRLAHGLKPNANTTNVNLEFVVQHDSIYHIPSLGNGNDEYKFRYELYTEVNRSIKSRFVDVTKKVSNEMQIKEIRKYSILYVGLPAVYVLINYYPDYNRINFIHIPHSTLLLNNEYRLSDIFFTLDINPTRKIVEHSLKQKIDYYLIQDRSMFIDLIDKLGGVNINLDAPYAEQYELSKGRQLIDGFHAWEYIRFLDWRNIDIKVKSEKKKDLIRKDNFEVSSRTWERIYEIRNQRQRYVLQGMRESFKSLPKQRQLDILENFSQLFQTDMSNSFLMQLYDDILTTKDFNFGSIPGYYGEEGDKLFYYPDLPNFEMLQEQQIRMWLEKRTGKEQTVY